MTKTDLIIIGAGPGGYRAAAHAARKGLKVTLFEGSAVGGTCLNVGCIPTKSLARNAEVMQLLSEKDTFGLDGAPLRLDFTRVIARKDQVVATLRSGIETLLSHPNVTLVKDWAHFIDAHTVGDTKGETYTAPHLIVATGSENRFLPGIDHCVTHEQLLCAPSLPQRLCIIGAGVIGMEFASIFAAFGTEVSVVEFRKECLPVLDSDIAKRLRKSLEKRGIRFFMQCGVKEVAKNEDKSGLKTVTFEDRKGHVCTVEADEVLMAVGRKPRTSDDFRLAGFDYDPQTGIRVDEHLETTVPGVYAIGDVNGRQMLAHAAEMQGLHAVNHLLGEADGMRLDVMPAAIFTHPEAACVGLSEDQCQAAGIDYECRKAFHRANGKALAIGEDEGMLKLLSEPGAGRIIGCHVFGAHAADLAQEVSVLMCRDTTVSQLRGMAHIHPTVGEVVLAAAEQ